MIHRTAIIDKNAFIEENVTIGPYTVVGPETVIKNGTRIHGQSFIEYADIGSNCEIFNFSSIGKCPQDLKYNGEKTKVVIGDGTVVRECVTLNRGTVTSGQTTIGKDCLLMACAHVAHDCIVGDNVIIGYSSALAGHVEVGANAILSAGVGVHQFCKVGGSVILGAGSMVSMDVIPYVMANGDRAVLSGLNIVGLKRRKVSSCEIKCIKKAYKVLFMSNLMLKEAVVKLTTMSAASPFIEDIVVFVNNSQRGIMRPR
jgi:UDP-N-acetylglucosamine acyltransferase